MQTFSVLVKNIEATNRLAQQLASSLQLGDTLILEGRLGVGKTHLVKALAASLKSQHSVTSPTYTIANFYDITLGKMLHIDAYRLASDQEFMHLGLEEYFDEAITVIEWGEKIASYFTAYILIKMEYVDGEDTHRKIHLNFIGKRWENFELKIN